MNASILKGRKIFLIDAIGAFVSTTSLLVPYLFEELFGMPKSALSIFISIAIVFSIYSTTIYFTNPANWKFYLTIIALLNISYCIFTAYHIFKNLNVITLYGHLYFFAEILIILTLSIFELKLSRTTNY
jgi:hypothetical protein